MKTIIDWLQQKNVYLDQLNELSAHEYRRVQSGDFSQINKFYHNRQVLLHSIQRVERQIQQCKDPIVNEEARQKMIQLLKKKYDIVLAILNKDIHIYNYINEWEKTLIEDQIA